MAIVANAEQRVNTTTSGAQVLPDVAMLADGGWLVTWQSSPPGYTSYDIFQQRYSAAGVKIGGEVQINAGASWETRAVVTALGDGGWLVAWSTARNGEASDGDVFQQRFDANGAKIGTELQVNARTSEYQSAPSVAGLADGGWIVTFEAWHQESGSTSYGIFQQRYDVNGAKSGAETLVNTRVFDDQRSQSVAALEDGGWVVTWASFGQDGSGGGWGIYQQRYDHDGVRVGGETGVTTTLTNQQISPEATALDDGGWLVIWASDQNGTGQDIYLQRFDEDGLKVGSEVLVNSTAANDQWGTSLTELEGGGWIITWYGRGPGDTNGIFQQIFDADGNKVGGETLVNVTTSGDQQSPLVAPRTDGGWVVTWWGNGADDPQGVYQRVYSNGPLVQPPLPPVNQPPVITSNGGAPLAIAVAENTIAVTTIVSTDPEGTARIYSIAGGADAGKFQIDAASGVLRFIAAPDFETPADSGGNNVYDIIVAASDGVLSDTQAIAVTVGNIAGITITGDKKNNTIDAPTPSRAKPLPARKTASTAARAMTSSRAKAATTH